jgi:hypothetical protein
MWHKKKKNARANRVDCASEQREKLRATKKRVQSRALWWLSAYFQQKTKFGENC